MATKINASQISTSTGSWYQRLRTIQGNIDTSFLSGTKISKTTDAGLTAGKTIKATDMNTFINALNGLQSNTFLSLADWTNKPATVTAGKAIDDETYNDINSTLTALEGICSNYGTKTTYSYSEKPNTCYNCTNLSTYTNYADHNKCTDTGCKTTECSKTSNSTYSNTNKGNSTNTKSTGNSTDNYSCKTATNTKSNSTYSKHTQTISGGGNTTNTTYNKSVSDPTPPSGSPANKTCKTISNSTYTNTTSNSTNSNTAGNSTNNNSCKTTTNNNTCKTNSTYNQSNSTYTKSNGGNTTYNQSYSTCNYIESSNKTNSVSLSNTTYTQDPLTATYGTYTVK